MANTLNLTVKLGGVYDTETQAGTVAQPSDDLVEADWLECTFFSVGSNGEIGEARLTGNKHPALITSDDIQNGQVVQLEDSVSHAVVFNGVVVKTHSIINPMDTKFEVVCYNTGDFLLRRLALHGQHRRTNANEQTYFTDGPADGAQGEALSTYLMVIDTPLIFNPDGEPNCSHEAYFDNSGGGEGGNTVYIFDVPFRDQYNSDGDHITSDFWTVKKAVAYLLNVYRTGWALDKTSFNDTAMGIFDANGDPVISNVNLEGRRLSEALTMLLEPHNYGYYVTQNQSDGKHSIHFFFRGTGDAVTVALPNRSGSSDTSVANLIHADVTDDATSVVNTITGFGSQKVITTLAHTNPPTPATDDPPVMKLVPGWNTADLVFALNDDGSTVNVYDTTFRKNYVNPYLVTPGTDGGNPYWAAGRAWVVNLGEAPWKDLENLTADFIDDDAVGNNSIDPRRLEGPMLFTRNSKGGRLQREDIQVEMSMDNGDHWAVIDRKWYRVLSDQMGIAFVDPYLERLGLDISSGGFPSGIHYWQALYNTMYKTPDLLPTIQIRILCSAKSDERVAARRDNAGDAFPLAIEGVYNNENGYRKFDYNPKINSTVYFTKNAPEEPSVDDTTALSDLCNQQATNTDRILNSGRLVLILDSWTQVKPGQTVGEMTNFKTFDPAATVVRVVYHVTDNHIELVLDNRRVMSVIRNRGTDGSNLQEHRLGIGNLSPLQGGNQGGFVPGNKRSFNRSLLEGTSDGNAE